MRDTLLFILRREPALPAENHVELCVLLVKDVDDAHPLGLLGRLRLERTSRGRGGFYPHPLYAGYLRMGEDFQQGLENAWAAAVGAAKLDFDVRFSVLVYNPYDGQPDTAAIDGRSAEAAFASALLALRKREQLDPHMAITAMLANPGEDLALAPVAGVRVKLLSHELKQRRISEVLVHENHDELKEPAFQPDSPDYVHLDPVADLDTAYQRLVRWRRMTRLANEKIAAAAQRELEEKCDPYIRSPLSRRLPLGEQDPESEFAERGRLHKHGPDDNRQPLSEAEIDEVERGRYDRRTCLLAESGMGKSMFLVNCEQKIAECNDGRLPIRIPQLSAINWHSDDDIINRLAGWMRQHFRKQGGDDDERGEYEYRLDDCRQWLQRLIDKGLAVFLLDALDQTPKDKLDGMSGYLSAGAVEDCTVLLTLRPYLLAGDDDEQPLRGDWERIDVCPFNRERQERFLGPEATEKLLHWSWERTQKEDYRDDPNHRKKEQWQPLLGVPLLLHMLRELSGDGELDNLPNRYAVYQRAVRHLVKKGWKTLKKTDYREKLLRYGDVERWLADLAWAMISSGNFTQVARGEAFEQLYDRLGSQELLKALTQVNFTTLESVLDSPGPDGLAWRHLSFCEYFAGVHLAGMDRREQTKHIRRHAGDRQWRWVFRFALCRAHEASGEEAAAALAEDLMRFGDPFTVAEAILEDGLELPGGLDRLCRWLVHRDWNFEHAWEEDWTTPELDAESLELLDSMFQPEYRDSRFVHAAWELLNNSDDKKAAKVRRRFRGEFAKMLSGQHESHAIAVALRDGFVRVPPDAARDGETFWMGSPEDEEHRNEDEVHYQTSLDRPFALAAFQITNEQFELFDPNHRQRHADYAEYSPEPSCPAIYVSWYAAKMFTLWLGDDYRLPSEKEWEYACRAGTTKPFHFGDTLSSHKANFNGNFPYGAEKGPYLGQTCEVGSYPPNDWGLYDMHGNVWEWCEDEYAEDPREAEVSESSLSSRVLRGGSWHYSARYLRSAVRLLGPPGGSTDLVGFRVSRALP